MRNDHPHIGLKQPAAIEAAPGRTSGMRYGPRRSVAAPMAVMAIGPICGARRRAGRPTIAGIRIARPQILAIGVRIELRTPSRIRDHGLSTGWRCDQRKQRGRDRECNSVHDELSLTRGWQRREECLVPLLHGRHLRRQRRLAATRKVRRIRSWVRRNSWPVFAGPAWRPGLPSPSSTLVG